MLKINADELCHHGTKGMKWYQRLYQYPDGSLTPLGRLRYRKGGNRVVEAVKKQGKKFIDNTSKKKKEKEKTKKAEEKRSKPISQMTDAELKEYISRMNDEKRAYELRNDLNRLNPKPKTLGQKIGDVAGKIGKDYVMPELVKIGGDYIKSQMQANQPKSEKQMWKEKEELYKSKYNATNFENLYNKAVNERSNSEKDTKNGRVHVDVEVVDADDRYETDSDRRKKKKYNNYDYSGYLANYKKGA